jgi:hypothetical protein
MNYLFNMNITPQPIPECNNGCPINKFPDGTTTTLTKSNVRSNNSFTNEDIVYSVYQTYQKTFTPMYIQNNLLQLTNPNNYNRLNDPMGPSNIFIIRHVEKALNNFVTPTNENTYYAADCNGIYRSIHLPQFINNLGSNGFPITAIVIPSEKMDINVNGNVSIRMQQTLTFSAWLLNIPVYMFSYANCAQPYDATTAINIFTNTSLRGKNILVSWQHADAQSLTNQLVQCYHYFKQGGTVQNLNNTTLYNVSTEEWWRQNTPVSPQYQYPGIRPPQTTSSLHPFPYKNYSQYLPYWNVNSYDGVYWLSQTNSPNNLTFNIFYQNITTCANGCRLLIGLLQWAYVLNGENEYANDGKCLPPD